MHLYKIMENCRRGGGEIIEQEDREYAVKLCFLVTSEAIAAKSHQHDYRNVS